MHSSKHRGRAARANGLAVGRLGRQADLLNADFIAQPFCLPPRGDTLSVSCVTSPYCDATSWQMKSTQATHAHTRTQGHLFFLFSASPGLLVLAANNQKVQRLQVALSVTAITLARESLGREGAATYYIWGRHLIIGHSAGHSWKPGKVGRVV